MPNERIVVIVPADAGDAESEYFRNFVWRVRRALEADHLNLRLVVAGDMRTEASR